MVVISHKHKFIFIKCIRTASSSMEEFFWRFRGDKDIFTPYPPKWNHKQNYKGFYNPLKDILSLRIFANNLPKEIKSSKYIGGWLINQVFRRFIKKEAFYDHMPAWMIKNRIGKNIFNSYFKFCFERNPYDKVVSRYLFFRKYGLNMSFRQFVKSPWVFNALNFPLYMDPSLKKVIVDYIGYYENLEEDFAKIMRKLKLPEVLDVNINTSPEVAHGYRKYYDKELKEIVSNIYRFELEMHGYDF